MGLITQRQIFELVWTWLRPKFVFEFHCLCFRWTKKPCFRVKMMEYTPVGSNAWFIRPFLTQFHPHVFFGQKLWLKIAFVDCPNVMWNCCTCWASCQCKSWYYRYVLLDKSLYLMAVKGICKWQSLIHHVTTTHLQSYEPCWTPVTPSPIFVCCKTTSTNVNISYLHMLEEFS